MTEPQFPLEALDLIRGQEEHPEVWENGVDLARLRENLKRTPAERLQKHETARLLAWELKQAGERLRSTDKSYPCLS